MSLRRLIGLPRSRYHQVILYKTYADLVSEKERFYIGYLWWVIEPVTEMAIYYLVFGVLFQRGTPDYLPFLFVGLLSWKWFSTSLTMGASSIWGNKGLMNQVQLPKLIFPTVSVLTNTFKFAIVFALLLAFLWLYGFTPGPQYAALPLLLLIQFIFIFATTLVCAAIVPFFPDFRIILGHGLHLVFFLSGLFYSGRDLSEKFQTIFYMNPLATIIESFRDVLMYRQWPDFAALGWIAGASLLLIAFGAWLIRRNDRLYPKVII